MPKSEESFYMIFKITTEKWKTVLSLVWHRLEGGLYCSMQLCKMVLSSIGFQYMRFFNADIKLMTFLGLGWMSWSFGIVLAIILLLLLSIF